MYFYGLRGSQTQGPHRAAYTLATPLWVAHFSFYGGGDNLHAPLATLLQEKFVKRNVAKEPKSSQIKILEPTASQKSQIH